MIPEDKKREEGGSIVKIEFTRASDLFGRITMYKFEVLGKG